MDWIDHSIWWQVYPIGFAGAERSRPNGPVEHRLPQLVGWLDYLIALGANGLILNPIFDSISHGYDTLNHYTIDPRLGDDADFDYLLAEAKKRGIRVVLDGVFNHVSRYHGIVLEALQDGPDSEAGRWLKWSDGHPMVFEGHSDLVELNLAEPMVADYITDIMLTWLERGIDGWRLDAAYAPGPDAWKPCSSPAYTQGMPGATMSRATACPKWRWSCTWVAIRVTSWLPTNVNGRCARRNIG